MTITSVTCISKAKALDTAEIFLKSIPKNQRDSVDIELIEKKEEEIHSKLKMHKTDMFVSRKIPHFKHSSEAYTLEFDFDEPMDNYKELINKAFKESKGFKEPKDFGKKGTFDYNA